MKQAKLVRVICQGTPECQWGDIEVYPVKRTAEGWTQVLGSVIGYRFSGVNDFEDMMEFIKGGYEVVEEVWV